jgi:hypothetical protein
MVWNSERGLLIPDPARRPVLICGVDCCGGACRGRGLATGGSSEEGAFSRLVSELDASRRSAYAASKLELVVNTSLLGSNPSSLTTAWHEGTL